MNAAAGFEIQLVDESGDPFALSNVSLEVTFFTNRRERYRFDVGASGSDGKLSVPYEKLDSIRKDNQAIALMDYNTKLEDCDDEILVRIPPLDELRNRLDAAKKWFPDQVEGLKRVIESSNNDALVSVTKQVALIPGEWTRIDVVARRR